MTDTKLNTISDKYAQNIKYGTHTVPDVPQGYSDIKHIGDDETKKIKEIYDGTYEKVIEKNKTKNEKQINGQLRLNNLKEINHSKQITIYIMYILLLVTGGLLIFILK